MKPIASGHVSGSTDAICPSLVQVVRSCLTGMLPHARLSTWVRTPTPVWTGGFSAVSAPGTARNWAMTVGAYVDTVAAAERAGGQGPAASASLAEQLDCTTVDRFEGGDYDLGEVDLGGEEAPTADAIAFGDGDVLTVDAVTTALGGTDLAGGDRVDVAVGDLRPELRTTGNDRPADRPWQRLVLMCAGLVALGGLLLGPGARSLLS